MSYEVEAVWADPNAGGSKTFTGEAVYFVNDASYGPPHNFQIDEEGFEGERDVVIVNLAHVIAVHVKVD